MAASQRTSLIDTEKFLNDTDPSSNPDTTPNNWNDGGMVEKAKKKNAKNVQDQFKKLGPHSSKPPIPK